MKTIISLILGFLLFSFVVSANGQIHGGVGPAGPAGPTGPTGPMPAIGGNDTEVQFNDGGDFAGTPLLTIDKVNSVVNVTPLLSVDNTNSIINVSGQTGVGVIGSSIVPLTISNGETGGGFSTGLAIYPSTYTPSNNGALTGITINSGHGSTGILGAVIGLEVASVGKGGSAGVITDNIGINIDDQTVATNNYAIKTGLGQNVLGDKLAVNGHFEFTGTSPVVSNTSAASCGTTAATLVGKDGAGKVTVGATSGTSCTVTFNQTWTNEPSCYVTNESTANLARATSTTSTVILTGTFVAGDVLAYSCIGWK